MPKLEQGWISIHRQIQSHWIWEDANKLKWWLDILLTVNTAPAKVNLGNQVFDCERGQSLISLQGWAKRWKTSKDTARNFLTLLEKQHMITRVNLEVTTRLTVCNYDSYQGGLHVNQTLPVRLPNASRTPSHPNNNNNKEDKENKEDKISFEDFWIAYDKKKGDKAKCCKIWEKLNSEIQIKIMEILPEWDAQYSDKQFKPYPATFLNQGRWQDELSTKSKNYQNTAQKALGGLVI